MARHKFSPEETLKGQASGLKTRRAQLKLQGKLAQIGLTESFLASIKDVAVEFIRTANSNPLMGIFTVLATTFTLYKLGVFNSTDVVLILGAVGLLEGAAVTPDVLDAIANDITAIGSILKPFSLFGGGAASVPNPLEPSATTIVYANGPSGNAPNAADLQALMSLFAKGMRP